MFTCWRQCLTNTNIHLLSTSSLGRPQATNANAPQSPTWFPSPAGTSSQVAVSAGISPWMMAWSLGKVSVSLAKLHKLALN